MQKQTRRRPAPRYRPTTPDPRYEREAERVERPRRDPEPRLPALGPYEYVYPVDLGYSTSPRFG